MLILPHAMSKKTKTIPVNFMADDPGQGIAIDRLSIVRSDFKPEQQYNEAKESHRDQGHTFHIVEKGRVVIEIDFQRYEVTAPSVVYMHPNQVHRILEFENVTVGSLAIKDEDLNPQYLEFLEDIVPVKPLVLTGDGNAVVANLFSISMEFSRQNDSKLHYSLLRDSCNTLVAFLISQLLSQHKEVITPSRFELISRSFKRLLEENYRTIKRPGEYADKLNISASYLNECVKHVTGFSASENIHERIILEAKRMLFHSSRSVKEISYELGYEDYPYFSKLFAKVAGMSAMSFRSKNHD